MIGKTLSHYRLVEKIGEGGMGVVWKAEDTVLGRTVAIKVLPADHARDEKRRKMFFDEARLASSLSEAHIVQVYDFGREGDLDFIVMEYIEGKALNKVLHGKPMPPERVAEIGHQVARALSKAHRKGLLHRDLKPANILITPDGDAKVVDFGLATLFTPQETTIGTAGPTQSLAEGSAEHQKGMVGTIPYMSPEQIRGEKLDARSDIFSLGSVLYEMTTGQRPFRGATNQDVLADILKSRPKAVHVVVPKVPLDLDRIITKSLSSRRGDRYQNSEDLAVDLKRLGRDLVSGSSPSYEELAKVVKPKRRWIGVAALVGVIAVAAIAWLFVSRLGTTVDPNTILVLPMEVRGQEEGAEYVGLAFAEAIVANLIQAKGLNILAVPDVGEMGGSGSQDRVRFARDLGAGRLITGSVTREGEAVNASLSLVDATKNSVVWASQESSADGDLSKLASSFAREIATELEMPFGHIYDAPEINPSGSKEFLTSVLLTDTLGAEQSGDLPNLLSTSKRLVEAFPNEADGLILRTNALFLDAWGAEPSSPKRQAFEDSLVAIDRVDPNHPADEVYRAHYINTDQFYPNEKPNQHRLALEMLNEVFSRDDLSPAVRAYVLRFRASCFRNLGKLSESLAELEEARRLLPTFAGIYQSLSLTLERMGDLEKAESYARQGLALNPRWSSSQGFLAWILMKQERFEEALEYARQAVSLNPKDYQHHWIAAEVLEKMGRFEEAAIHCEKACELSPTQGMCAYYAVVLHHAGQKAEARKAIEKAESLSEDTSGLYQMARYRALMGDRAEALRYLRRHLELSEDPDLDPEDTTQPDFTFLHGDPEFDAYVAEVKRRIKAWEESEKSD